MRILFCGNGPSAVAIARYLKSRQDAQLVGCVVHPSEHARERDEIIEICEQPVVIGREINEERGQSVLARQKPDVLLSVHFGYLFTKEVLDLVQHPLNVHPAFLPYGRGAHPNVWALVEGTPAGVTIHYMTDQVDQGDVLTQEEVPYDWTDTAQTLYERLLLKEVSLFREFWPAFVRGRVRARPQFPGGTFHKRDELSTLARLDLDADTSVRALLNRLRACTFPPHPSCFVETERERIYFRVLPYRDIAAP